jgi:site-specific recombinase XerD
MGYRVWLEHRGYTPTTIRNMLKELGQVGRWLSAEDLSLAELDADRLTVFRSARQTAGYRRVPGVRALVPLLSYLREVGVVPQMAPPLVTPQRALLELYESWMIQERNLALATVLRYANTARRFLVEQASDGEVFEPEALTGADVNAFLLRECARVSAGSAKPGSTDELGRLSVP